MLFCFTAIAEANESAIDLVAKLVEQEYIDCDFSRQSAYVYTQDESYLEKIGNEYKVAKQLGIKAHLETKLPLPISIKGATSLYHKVSVCIITSLD